MYEVYANDINPFNNRPRRTERYIVAADSGYDAVSQVKASATHEGDTWKYNATNIGPRPELVDSWEP